MKTLLYLLPLCTLLQLPSGISLPVTNDIPTERNYFRFGDQVVTIEKTGMASSKNYVLLSLHSDEESIINTFTDFSRSHDVFFVKLVHGESRNIEGNFIDQKISFDPNNIFTSWGRKEHLKEHGCWSKYIDIKVEQFARYILNEIPADRTIVSLHNHNDVTMIDFEDEKPLRKQVKDIYRNKDRGAEDYYVTTDESIYEQLKKKQYNVVLYHSKKILNDGALAVYCARAKRPYVHIEAGNNKATQQEMLGVLDEILK